jgi:hypothetical protein
MIIKLHPDLMIVSSGRNCVLVGGVKIDIILERL